MSERVHALASDPERLRVFTGKVLDLAEPDPELQEIVSRASEVAGVPISLVSLILDRTQCFRAQVGLPVELAAAGATDRSLSFCQLVVRDRALLEVEDAAGDERFPQGLVDRYGVRSYLGYPLFLGSEVAGTLCVIDSRPRTHSPEVKEELSRLAKRANARLSELALSSTRGSTELARLAAGPAFLEIRNLLGPLEGFVALSRTGAAEVAAIVRASGESSGDRDTVRAVLPEAGDASSALLDNLERLESVTFRLTRSLLALESIVHADPAESTRIGIIVDVASELARHVTKQVGGIDWDAVDPALEVRVPRALAVSALTTILTNLATAARSSCSGLHGEVVEQERWVEIRVAARDGLEEDASRCAARVSEMLGALTPIRVGNDGLAVVLTFLR